MDFINLYYCLLVRICQENAYLCTKWLSCSVVGRVKSVQVASLIPDLGTLVPGQFNIAPVYAAEKCIPSNII